MTDNGFGLENRVNEPYSARYPPKEGSRDAAILLVTNSPGTASAMSELLVVAGYAVKPVSNVTAAIEFARGSYIEAIVLDVEGTVPSRRERYDPKSEAAVFLEQLWRVFKFPVILISSRHASEYSPPSIADLLILGASGSTASRQPFEVTELIKSQTQPGNQTADNEFLGSLLRAVSEVKGAFTSTFTTIGKGLPPVQSYGVLPNIGSAQAAAQAYERDRQGGAAHFLTDAINGISVEINPDVVYPRGATTFHIKRGPLSDAVRAEETHRFIAGKNPGRVMPAPRGHAPSGDLAYRVQTFVIGSNFSDIRKALDPGNDPLGMEIWNHLLQEFFTSDYPDWYKDTHERIMQSDHDEARQNLTRRQIDSILLLPTNLSSISGRTVPPGLQQRIVVGTYGIYQRSGQIDGRLFVLPLDPKGVNIGRLTYQSRPAKERLIELSTTQAENGQRRVDPEKLNAIPFAHWGHSSLGAVTTVFAELWQTLLDPRLDIPEEQQPLYMAQATQAIFPDVDPNNFLMEIYRQGLYRAAFRAYVTAAHAQVNEGRLVTMKTLDTSAVNAEREWLQAQLQHYLRQTLKFASGFYHARDENHTASKWPYGLERMTEHFSDSLKWMELKNGKNRLDLRALSGIHEGFSHILREGPGGFDPDLLRRNFEQGKVLRY